MEYMRNPRSLTSGAIAMNFSGLPKEQDRADILAYLHTLKFPAAPEAKHQAVIEQPYGKVKFYKNDRQDCL